MANFFDQFDSQQQANFKSKNFFDQFDIQPDSQKTMPEELTWGEVVGSAVSNIPKSGLQFVEDVVSPFLHPIETTKALGALGKGAFYKAVPGRQQEEQIVDQLIDVFTERYGSLENFKRTLAVDPVGVTGDIASLFTGGGALLKGAGVASKAGKLAKVGKTVAEIGKRIDPLSVAGKGLKTTTQKLIPKGVPSSLYESAVKFSTVIPESVRKSLAKTALDEEIMPTLKGLEKARTKIDEINTDITAKIDAATEAGKIIPTKALFTNIKELRQQAKLTAEPIKNLNKINKIVKEIALFNKNVKADKWTPQEVQKLKQNIYKETEKLYTKVTEKPVAGKTKMAIARSAKESLERLFPEIKALNKREGSIIALKKELEKSASRISNRDILGIGAPIKGGAGGVIGGVPGLVGGLTIGLLDTPSVKAKLAIVANRLKKKGVILADDSLLRKILEAGQVMPLATRGIEQIREAYNEQN